MRNNKRARIELDEEILGAGTYINIEAPTWEAAQDLATGVIGLTTTVPTVATSAPDVSVNLVINSTEVAKAVTSGRKKKTRVVASEKAVTDLPVREDSPVENEPTPEPESDSVPPDTETKSKCNPVLDMVSADDFKGIRKRRDIVRTIMDKGVTELDDIVSVCENLKEDVRLLQMLGNIPPAIKSAFEAVQKENQAS